MCIDVFVFSGLCFMIPVDVNRLPIRVMDGVKMEDNMIIIITERSVLKPCSACCCSALLYSKFEHLAYFTQEEAEDSTDGWQSAHKKHPRPQVCNTLFYVILLFGETDMQ